MVLTIHYGGGNIMRKTYFSQPDTSAFRVQIHLYMQKWLKTHAYSKSIKEWFKKLWPKSE